MLRIDRHEIFSAVPDYFWHTDRSQALKHQLVRFDPSLENNPDKLGFIHGIMVAHNYAVSIVESKGFRSLRAQKLRTLADAILGIIPCFDGRNVPMLQGGRELSYHPAAGGMIEYDNYGNGLYLPRSANLREGITTAAQQPEHHLTEFVAGHAPGLDEKKPPKKEGEYGATCGKLELEKAEGRLYEGETLIQGSLRLTQPTVEAVNKQYGNSREEAGLYPLDEVALPVTFDTYRRGFVIGADQNPESGKRYSTTLETERIASKIESVAGKEVGEFGSMAETYTRLDKLLEVSQARFRVTRQLLTHQEFGGFRTGIANYIHDNNPGFTEKQLWGITYFIAFTTAMQYLAGLADRDQEPKNPHIHHGELVSVLSKVRNPFLLFSHIQTFSSNPPESHKYADHGRLQNNIMEAEGRNNPIIQDFGHIMFLPTPIDGSNMTPATLTTARADNGESVRAIYQDEHLSERYRQGRFSGYPMLTDSRTREVLLIPNQRTYAFGT